MRIISAVKRVEFVSVRISYIILRGRWCDMIVLNVNDPTKTKLMMRRIGSAKNYNMYSINSVNTSVI
jgi:hypothetical protein